MHGILHETFRMLVGVAIPLAAFATGLRAANVSPTWLFRRPRLLALSLLSILVVVPLGAVLFLQAIHAAVAVKSGIAIAIVAIGIGPPAAWKRSQGQDESIAYEISLNILLLLLAIVYIPLVVALYGAIFHTEVRLYPGQVAMVVLTRALGPLLIGVVVARLAPRAVAPVRRYAGLFVQVALLLVVALALIATWRTLFGLGTRTWLICAAIAAGEIVVGHLAGGPERDTRRVLAAFSTMRFPALAILLASATRWSGQLIPIILAYTITSAVLVAVYSAIMSIGERKRGRLALVPAPSTAPSPTRSSSHPAGSRA